MIDADFVTWLNAQSGITTLCSSRIYALILPEQPTYPAITFNSTDLYRDYTFDGEGTLAPTEMQIDCWAQTYEGSRQLLQAVINAIKNFTGTMGSSTTISQVILGADVNVYEDQVLAYRSSITVTLWNYGG